MFTTEQELASIVTSLVLLAILVLAVRQDLVERRISNILTFGALAAALAILSLAQGFDGLVHALVGAGVGLLCLLPLYLCKGMGAGDVKLMTAAGAFLGPFNAFAAALLALAFGAVLAIVVVVWRVVEMRAATAGAGAGAGSAVGIRSALSHAGKERFPYAVAIALGVISTMWIRGMLEPLIRSFT